MTDNLAALREAFFDSTHESHALFDKDLNFIEVNQALLLALGFKKEQIIGKNVRDISPGIEHTDRYRHYLDVIKTGIPTTLDEVRMHPSLGNFVTRISIFKVGDGLGLSALNITDLNDAIDELETFSYRSAHDMRAPIANILGLIDYAATDMENMDSAQQYLEMIKAQAERLDNILLKLVETARIRQGEKTIYLIQFPELIHDILESLSYMDGYRDIDIQLDIAAEQKFYSDKPLILSLLQNLIDNAIKYKKYDCKDAFIKIAVADDQNGVKITVADNGIGIRDDLQHEVFNIFFRATNQSAGSGLGLYTVKHCVKKLGGKVRVDSKESVGSTFTVNLPNEKMA